MSEETLHALEILKEINSCTLATVEPDGSPRATPMFFAFDEQLRIYFLSDPKTVHVANLLRDARVAMGFYPEVSGWKEIRGLQMKGTAGSLPEAELDTAWAVYQARFPFLSEIPEAVEVSDLYRFEPRWVRIIDNRRGFAFQVSWDME